MEPSRPFDEQVASIVRAIPEGRVLSYGEVAVRTGRPQGARAVASALGRLHGIPWWRVVRSDGTLAPPVADEQGRRLLAEGVLVKDGRIVRKP